MLWQFADVCAQELCREIHHKIDKIDEERYDLDMKVTKTNKEVDYYYLIIKPLQSLHTHAVPPNSVT